MKKKVLFLITKATWGGAQKYVYDLATNLPGEEFEATVAYGSAGALSEELAKAGVALKQLPSLQRDVSLFSDARCFFQILAYMRATRPDIVHLNSSKAAAFGALAARFAGVRRILFTVHGWPFNEPRSMFSRLLVFLASWITALSSHRVILVSRADESQCALLPGISRKCSYIPLGLTETNAVARNDARRALLLSSDFSPGLPIDSRLKALEGKKLILTIAELTKNKGLSYGIEAVAELRRRGHTDFVYFIAGTGELRERLANEIRLFNLGDQVFLLGFIPQAAIYVEAADYFLLPSLKEGLPYVILEAAYAGVPIIASDVGGISDILRTYESCSLVPPRNPNAIANAIVALERGPAAPRGAQEKIRRAFGLPEMLRRTTALYR